MIIYLVQHLHTLPDGAEDIKTIGVYDSKIAAIAAVDRLKGEPGFIDAPKIIDSATDDGVPDGFYIDEYEMNKDHWTSGFVTV